MAMTGGDVPKWRQVVDMLGAALGLGGAAFEIFYHQGDNYFVYVLIIFLLRSGTALAEKILEMMKR